MKERMSRGRNDMGFTLFELLIVIVILAILAAIVAFSVGTSSAGAKTSSCQSDAKAFENAVEEYYADIGTYAPRGPINYPTASPYPWLTTPQVAPDGQTYGPFLRQLPGLSHYQIVTDGNDGVFVYPAGDGVPGALTMDKSTFTVASEVPGSADPALMNFETNPAICSDPNVVS
jgi:prepilin-type N-terminal cleavage/methylation domain-containing protein